MIIRMPFLALSLVLVAGVAAGQSPPGPIAGGRQHQPTRQEIESRGVSIDWEWNRQVQTGTDRLYDAIIRAATPSARR
jgi:hypothetical protein